jgi:hypothetical protein
MVTVPSPRCDVSCTVRARRTLQGTFLSHVDVQASGQLGIAAGARKDQHAAPATGAAHGGVDASASAPAPQASNQHGPERSLAAADGGHTDGEAALNAPADAQVMAARQQSLAASAALAHAGGQQHATSTQNADEAVAEERPAASDGDTIEMRDALGMIARASSCAGVQSPS